MIPLRMSGSHDYHGSRKCYRVILYRITIPDGNLGWMLRKSSVTKGNTMRHGQVNDFVRIPLRVEAFQRPEPAKGRGNSSHYLTSVKPGTRVA